MKKRALSHEPTATPDSKPKSLEEWWEGHPLKCLVGIATACVRGVSGVETYFFTKRLRIERDSASFALEKTKSECQAKIDGLKSLVTLIQRRVGDKSIWDLSSIVVTPDEAKTLGPQYVYSNDLHCYLSIPGSSSCSFFTTTETGEARMIYLDPPSPSALPVASEETEALLELGKELKVYLWRWPTSFVVRSDDHYEPTICVFPYVSIEEVTHEVAAKKLFPLISRLTERLAAYFQTELTAINIWVDSVNEMANQNPTSSGFPPLILPQAPHISLEGLRESGQELVRSFVPDMTTDSAAFVWASRHILAQFERTQHIPKSSFQLRNAEKQRNVFHLSERIIFPASNTTPEIYWDQEIIFVTTTRATFIVTISTPWSLQQRFTEESWIAGWLAGL